MQWTAGRSLPVGPPASPSPPGGRFAHPRAFPPSTPPSNRRLPRFRFPSTLTTPTLVSTPPPLLFLKSRASKPWSGTRPAPGPRRAPRPLRRLPSSPPRRSPRASTGSSGAVVGQESARGCPARAAARSTGDAGQTEAPVRNLTPQRGAAVSALAALRAPPGAQRSPFPSGDRRGAQCLLPPAVPRPPRPGLGRGGAPGRFFSYPPQTKPLCGRKKAWHTTKTKQKTNNS